MNEKEFVKICKIEIIKYYQKNLDVSDNHIVGFRDIYIVWMCKTLQNNKALFSTNLIDEMYFELTYNGDKKELYLDAYKKLENKKIEL